MCPITGAAPTWYSCLLEETATAQELLARIANGYRKIQDEQTEVLAVLQCTTEKAARVKDQASAKFPVLIDRDGRIHRAQDTR